MMFFCACISIFCPGDICSICISDTFISSCVSHDKHVIFQLWTFICNLYSVSVWHFWCLLYFLDLYFVICICICIFHFVFETPFLWLYFCLFLFLFLHFYFIPLLLWLLLAPASPPPQVPRLTEFEKSSRGHSAPASCPALLIIALWVFRIYKSKDFFPHTNNH